MAGWVAHTTTLWTLKIFGGLGGQRYLLHRLQSTYSVSAPTKAAKITECERLMRTTTTTPTQGDAERYCPPLMLSLSQHCRSF